MICFHCIMHLSSILYYVATQGFPLLHVVVWCWYSFILQTVLAA